MKGSHYQPVDIDVNCGGGGPAPHPQQLINQVLVAGGRGDAFLLCKIMQ